MKSTKFLIFNNVSFMEKLLFTRHLSVMIKSGIPISEAIEAIADQTTNISFKGVLKDILKEILNGQSLETALKGHSEIFDPLYTNLIRVGEQSGNLEKNLKYLSDVLQKDYQFKQKVIAASLYPSIVLSSALIVGGGVSFFVLPKLIDLFESLDAKLPLSTKILLWFAGTMKDFGIYIFGYLIISFIVFRLLLLIKSFKFSWQKFLLSLPVIGVFIQNVALTTICRNMGIMLESGIPITAALKAQVDSTENLVFKRYMIRLLESVEKGKTIEEGLSSKRFKYIPRIVAKMIGIGEKTGKLDETFIYLGDFFDDEVDNASKNFSNILEPVLLLGIGLIVAFVALSIISPIYEFTGSVKK